MPASVSATTSSSVNQPSLVRTWSLLPVSLIQSQEVSMSSEKSSKEGRMHSSVNPRDALSRLVEPKAFDTREHWLDAVARKAGISYRAAKGIFYGEITDPEHRAFRRVTDKILEREKRIGAEHDRTNEDSRAILDRALALQAEALRIGDELAAIREELVRRGALDVRHTPQGNRPRGE
jgi:hypothetical protein